MVENVYRSSTDKWLGGVAGGLAKRSGLPSLVVRGLLVILGLLFNVLTVVIYLTLWLVLPEAPMVEVDEAPEIVEEPTAAPSTT